MAHHATRYALMPIPPIETNTRYFKAGPITIGVEYRLLNDELVNQHMTSEQQQIELPDNIDDRGVSLHVFGAHDSGEQLEYLRFDCFDVGFTAPERQFLNRAQNHRHILFL